MNAANQSITTISSESCNSNMEIDSANSLYQLFSVRKDTGVATQMTAYPDTLQHCETIKSKCTVHKLCTLVVAPVDLSLVKFNKHNVTNGTTKARVFYTLDNRVDGRYCVTIYAKDFGHALRNIFGAAYTNSTDTSSDSFDQGKATLFADHPLYATARARVQASKS